MQDANAFLLALQQEGASSTSQRFVSLSGPFADSAQWRIFLDILAQQGPANSITGIRLQANLGDDGAAELAPALACCNWLETLELPGELVQVL